MARSMTCTAMFGGNHLDHGDLRAGRLVARPVHQVGGFQRQEPRLLDLDPRLGDLGPDRALLGERPPEGGPCPDAPAHRLQAALGQADQAHRVVNPPRPEPPLRDLEPPGPRPG